MVLQWQHRVSTWLASVEVLSTVGMVLWWPQRASVNNDQLAGFPGSVLPQGAWPKRLQRETVISGHLANFPGSILPPEGMAQKIVMGECHQRTRLAFSGALSTEGMAQKTATGECQQ